MADPLDILTLIEAKAVLSVGSFDTGKDDTLEMAVTAASRKLDECVGPVVQRSVTSETLTARGTRIKLSLGPVTAISSITEDGTLLSAGDWYAEPYPADPQLLSGIVIRRAGDYPTGWQCGLGWVQVGYLAGRFASTTQVEAKYKNACGLILKNLWRTYENNVGTVDEYDLPHQSFPSFGVPKAVRDLLTREWQTTAGFGA